jgi:hypothetical protein
MVRARVNRQACILHRDERIPAEDAPFGYPHMYHLRHSEDDWTCPDSIERFVLVNFFGTIFLENPLDIGEDGYVDIWNFETEDDHVKFFLRRTLLKKLLRV